MDEKQTQEAKVRLTELIAPMQVPTVRRELTESNLRWLSRNLMIRNSSHSNFREAQTLLVALVALIAN